MSYNVLYENVVYKGGGVIEAGRVPDSDYVYCQAISKGNTLMKFG